MGIRSARVRLDQLWTEVVDGYRQVGIYAGRILKGETTANLPCQISRRWLTDSRKSDNPADCGVI